MDRLVGRSNECMRWVLWNQVLALCSAPLKAVSGCTCAEVFVRGWESGTSALADGPRRNVPGLQRRARIWRSALATISDAREGLIRACVLQMSRLAFARCEKGTRNKLWGWYSEGEKTVKDGNASRTLLGFPALVILFIDFGRRFRWDAFCEITFINPLIMSGRDLVDFFHFMKTNKSYCWRSSILYSRRSH